MSFLDAEATLKQRRQTAKALWRLGSDKAADKLKLDRLQQYRADAKRISVRWRGGVGRWLACLAGVKTLSPAVVPLCSILPLVTYFPRTHVSCCVCVCVLGHVQDATQLSLEQCLSVLEEGDDRHFDMFQHVNSLSAEIEKLEEAVAQVRYTLESKRARMRREEVDAARWGPLPPSPPPPTSHSTFPFPTALFCIRTLSVLPLFYLVCFVVAAYTSLCLLKAFGCLLCRTYTLGPQVVPRASGVGGEEGKHGGGFV